MSSTADLSNWRTHPHSQWTFQNVDKLISTQVIQKSTSPVVLKEERSTKVNNLQIPITDDKTLDIKQLLQLSHTDGFVVLHRGKLIYDYYSNGHTSSSKHILFSVSKSITSLIIGALVAKGLLQVDEKITKYMPELEGTAFAPATIRHLLDMRAGISYPDNSPGYRAACGWEPFAPGQEKVDLPTFFSKFSPPGTVPPPAGFVYATVSTDVLGLLVERISGKTYVELAHEYLWQPAGAETDALMTVDSSGRPRAGGGIATTVEDLARVGQAIIDGKVASKEWINDILNGGDIDVFQAGAWGPGFNAFSQTLAYRSFWVASGEEKFLLAQGIHGQMLAIDLKNEIVMAKTSSQPEMVDLKSTGLALRLYRTLQHVLKSQDGITSLYD